MMMHTQRRVMMVKNLEAEGIRDRRVLEAMKNIPRHEFVPEHMQAKAYSNVPLPIGYGQTISQPYTVAFMLEALELDRGNKVLEIGAGSGYNTSLIAEIVGKNGMVYSIEIIPELIELAKTNIGKLGINNIRVIQGDGSAGYEKEKPYDRIIITAGAPKIPETLVKQLKREGVIVGPVGSTYSQNMVRLKKKKGILTREDLGEFMFVPLRGKYGFKAKDI